MNILIEGDQNDDLAKILVSNSKPFDLDKERSIGVFNSQITYCWF